MKDGVRAADHGFHFRISTAQRDQLKAEAERQNLSVQQLLELKVFGELLTRQRKRGGSRPATGQTDLLSTEDLLATG